MGLFDRLGNLGKGMVGIMKQGGDSAEARMAALEAELGRIKRSEPLSPKQAEQVDEGEGLLRQLKALHTAGVLSDTEYAEKLASLAEDKLPAPQAWLDRHDKAAPADTGAEPDTSAADSESGSDGDDEPVIKKTL